MDKRKSISLIKEFIDKLKKDYKVEKIVFFGSRATGKAHKDSDIDLLVITNNTNKRIDIGKYNFILISKKVVEEKLETDILPLLPMIKEANSARTARTLSSLLSSGVDIVLALQVTAQVLQNRKYKDVLLEDYKHSI